MNKLYKFFPPDFLQFLKNHDDLSEFPHDENVGVMFLDISGFTKLSEKLREEKKSENGEFLASLISSTFKQIIRVLTKWNGNIYKIIGDAFTVIFHSSGDEKKAKIEMVQCAFEIINKIKNHKTIKYFDMTFKPSLTIGLSWGNIRFDILGNENTKLELMVVGNAINEAVRAETIAEPLQLVVYRDFINDLEDVEYKQINNDFYQILKLNTSLTSDSIKIINSLPQKKELVLKRFLPPQLVSLLSTANKFIDEFKLTTIMFLNITDLLKPDPMKKLHRLYSEIFDIIYKYNGYLNLFDYGDKGGMFVVLFGTPKSIELPEYLAGLCAIELKEKYKKISIGLARGIVFSGLIGGYNRLHYTVIGDRVNLTARLMQSGIKDYLILTNNDFFKKVNKNFEGSFYKKLSLKGFKDLVSTYVLNKVKQQPTELMEIDYKTKLIGRKQEFNFITTQITMAKHQKTPNYLLIQLIGSSGIGKTHLIKSINYYAKQNGVNYIYLKCLPETQHKLFYILKIFLLKIFNLPISASIKDIKAVMENMEFFKTNAQIKKNIYMIFNIASNVKIDSENKKFVLFDALKKTLDQFVPKNIIIEIDDVQWLDEYSKEFISIYVLDEKVRDKNDILILSGYESIISVDIPRKSDIYLQKFTFKEFEKMLKQIHSIKLYDKEVEKIFYEKSEGIPLYIEEIINYIKNSNKLIAKDNVYTINSIDFELPDNVKDLANIQFDRLDNNIKNIMKIASVFGHTLIYKFVKFIINKELNISSTEQEKRLNDFFSLHNIVKLVNINPELIYMFKDLLLRDTAYNSLLHKQKVTYHKYLSNILASKYEITNNPDILSDIVYHMSLLPPDKEKIKYYMYYCRYNKQKGFYTEIVYWVEKLLQQHKYIPAYEKGLFIKVLIEAYFVVGKYEKILKLLDNKKMTNGIKDFAGYSCYIKGKTYYNIGKFDKAYDSLMNFNPKNELQKIKKKILLIKVYANLGKSDLISTTIKEVNEIYSRLKSKPYFIQFLLDAASAYYIIENFSEAQSFLERAKLNKKLSIIQKLAIYREMGNVLVKFGKIKMARRYLANGLKLSTKIGHIRFIAQFELNLGNTYYIENKFDNAMKYFNAAYEKFVAISDFNNIAVSINNLGNCEYLQKNFNKAEQYFKKGLELTKKYTISKSLIALFHENLGDTYWSMSKIKEAKTDYELSLKIYKEIGNLRGIAHIYGNLANIIESEGGDRKEQIKLLKKQAEICEQINDVMGLGKAYYNISWIYAYEQDIKKSEEYLIKAEKEFSDLNYLNGLSAVKEMWKFINEQKEK